MKPTRALLAACFAVYVAFSACAARRAANPKAVASVPVSLEDWQSETFPLPPAFAPGLPTGSESLRFPPGWRDPKSENFWSYAFVMWIDEPAPDAARLDDLLERYYNGLMTAFAEGKEIAPVRVEVASTSGDSVRMQRFEARMHLTDAFATFKPIDVRVRIETATQPGGQTVLRIRVSPQPKELGTWNVLDAAIADILSQHDARREKPE